jgi:hypothetical protein
LDFDPVKDRPACSLACPMSRSKSSRLSSFPLLELFDPLEQLAQFAQSNAAFFLEPILTFDENVEFLILRQELNTNL